MKSIFIKDDSKIFFIDSLNIFFSIICFYLLLDWFLFWRGFSYSSFIDFRDLEHIYEIHYIRNANDSSNIDEDLICNYFNLNKSKLETMYSITYGFIVAFMILIIGVAFILLNSDYSSLMILS